MATSFQLVLGTVLAFVLWHIFLFIKNYWKICAVARTITPIGPTQFFWGNMKNFSSSKEFQKLLFDVVRRTKAKMVVSWRMFITPVFLTTHPDTAKIILKSSAPKPTKYGAGYAVFLPWIGRGLLISEGKKWERNRRLLTPAFHFDVLRPYIKIYHDVADVFTKKLKALSKDNKSVEVFKPVGLLTLDTMLRCALSYDDNVQEKGDTHPYVQAVKGLALCCQYRSMRPYLQPFWVYKWTANCRKFLSLADYVHEFAEEIIEARKKKLKEDPTLLQKRHLDFLDILVSAKDENGVGLTNTEIREEVDTFLFEGHDTTSSALSWALYCLGKYPNEQEKVYDEIKGILKDKSNLEWSDLQNMSRMTIFLKEVMRLYPPVPGISRELTSDVEIDGKIIPKGYIVGVMIRIMQRNPEVWADPDEFKPERFLEKNEKGRDAFNFVPFSAGPRNCIGQHFAMDEMKVVLCKVLTSFRVLHDPNHEPDPMPMLILRSENGVKVKFEPRYV